MKTRKERKTPLKNNIFHWWRVMMMVVVVAWTDEQALIPVALNDAEPKI